MIWMIGDCHGQFDYILEAIDLLPSPSNLIFLGDLECPVALEECVAGIETRGIRSWFIPGNHDTDTADGYRNLFDSPVYRERSLHCRVREIDGFRVGGFGGVFRQQIWYPRLGNEQPNFTSYNQYAEYLRNKRPLRLRRSLTASDENGYLPSEAPLIDEDCFAENRKHRTSIFFDDWSRLLGQQADLLVFHEAPCCHPQGFAALTELARSMKAKQVFHGHHHDNLDYRAHYSRLGFAAHGVGLRGIKDQSGRLIRTDEIDAHYRSDVRVRSPSEVKK